MMYKVVRTRTRVRVYVCVQVTQGRHNIQLFVCTIVRERNIDLFHFFLLEFMLFLDNPNNYKYKYECACT